MLADENFVVAGAVSHSMSSRSRSKQSVGFSPARWNGAMKMPNFTGMVLRLPNAARLPAIKVGGLPPDPAYRRGHSRNGERADASIQLRDLRGKDGNRLSAGGENRIKVPHGRRICPACSRRRQIRRSRCRGVFGM